jgi:hypothetical protein
MRVFVRDLGTGYCFGTYKQWTADQNAFVDFETSINALEFCREYNVQNAEILLAKPGEAPEFRIAVDAVLRTITTTSNRIRLASPRHACTPLAGRDTGRRFELAGEMKLGVESENF